jgi:hypothetical protein
MARDIVRVFSIIIFSLELHNKVHHSISIERLMHAYAFYFNLIEQAKEEKK